MMEQMRSEAQNQVAILALNFCVGCRLREGWEVHPTPIESEEQAKSVWKSPTPFAEALLSSPPFCSPPITPTSALPGASEEGRKGVRAAYVEIINGV